MIRFTVPAMAWVSKKTGKQRFIIDGFYVQGKRPNWTRLARYRQWQGHIQECAVIAGISLPLRPTKEEPLYVVTITHFASGTHCDPGNTFKSVVDALCYVSPEEQDLGIKRGSDKYMGGIFFAPQYDKQNPRVEVKILTEQEFNRVVLDHSIAVIERLIAEEKEEQDDQGREGRC